MNVSSENDQNQPFRLGELLVREGYLTIDALNKVLELQKPQGHISTSKRGYKPLGQLCLELNLMTREELQRVLRQYNKRIYIGELLINMGFINQQQLEKALRTKKNTPHQRLGEILIEQTPLSETHLIDALSLQMDVPRMIPSLELIDQNLLKGLEQTELEQHLYMPMARNGNVMTVVMYDPNNLGLIELLERRFSCKVEPALAESTTIRKSIVEYFQRQNQFVPKSTATTIATAQPGKETFDWQKVLPQMNKRTPTGPLGEPSPPESDNNAPHVATFLMTNALKDRASDIHIEPQEKYIRIRYRIDGVLHHKTDLPIHLGPPLISYLKQICGMTATLPRYPNSHGRIAGEFGGRPVELSIATSPSLWGQTMVIHLQEKQGNQNERLFNLERLGFSPCYLQQYRQVLERPGGLVLITGPARTGKSTTLYASANDLNQNNHAILSAEEAIENILSGVVQGAFDPALGSYADMIRAVTAQDPDVLMVNEINGQDSLQAALDATFTGAKVITAFRSFEPIGGLLHLLDQGLYPYLIASCQLTILSQRLVRRLCQSCKVPAQPAESCFQHLGLLRVQPDDYPFYRSPGCSACNQKGFDGQLALHEMIVLNEAIREALLARKPAATIRGLARTECGLIAMAEDGLYKAIEGYTSLEEVQRVACINEYDNQLAWTAQEIYVACAGD